MESVLSAQASVLVNGSSLGNICLQRGLRQGDPLSHFLFLMAAERMSTMMKNVIEQGLYEPIGVGKDRVSISHLQFADDRYLWEKHPWKMPI